jgi:hypothetical protein
MGIEWGRRMRARILIAAVAFLVPVYAWGQTDASATADSSAIQDLLGQYAKAVDTVDIKLLAQIWSHSPDVSFIYPLGEEHGFDAIPTKCLPERNGRNVFGARP